MHAQSVLIQLKMIPYKGLHVDVLFMSHASISSYFPRKSAQHISPKNDSCGGLLQREGWALRKARAMEDAG